MKKYIVIAMSLIVAVPCILIAIAIFDDNTGFRAIQCDEAPLPQMKIKSSNGEKSIYILESDSLMIADAHVENIEYTYWNNKLLSVDINIKTFLDAAKLHSALNKKLNILRYNDELLGNYWLSATSISHLSDYLDSSAVFSISCRETSSAYQSEKPKAW